MHNFNSFSAKSHLVCVNLVFLRKLWKEILCFLGGGGGRDEGKLHSCNKIFTTTGRDSYDNSHSAMTPAMAVSLAVQISPAFYLIYQPSSSVCTPKIPTIMINFLMLSIADCSYNVQHSFNTQSGMTAAMAVSPAVQISPAFQVAHNRDKLISPQVRMPRAKNVPFLTEVLKKNENF